jgi:hypothetical protein
MSLLAGIGRTNAENMSSEKYEFCRRIRCHPGTSKQETGNLERDNGGP